jgi:hypothetical protein
MDENATTNTLIKFNTETSINQPKFELGDGVITFQYDHISLTIFDNLLTTFDETIDNIIKMYKITNDIEYITRTMVIPFSFLLVDLDIHKPQYTAFFVVQPFDSANYYIDNYTIVRNYADVLGTVKGELLMRGKIFVFTLDAKAISQWQFNLDKTMVVHIPPVFYITENDFYNYLDDGGKSAAKFLSDILQKCATIDDPILYNYCVEHAIHREAKFAISDYMVKQTLVAFYLLVYPVLRFNKRTEILEKTFA